MEKSIDTALAVAKSFVKEVLPFYDKDGIIDKQQIITSLHPYISNVVYANTNEVLEKERMETLITLARTLDNENIEKAVKALRYQILVKK